MREAGRTGCGSARSCRCRRRVGLAHRSRVSRRPRPRRRACSPSGRGRRPLPSPSRSGPMIGAQRLHGDRRRVRTTSDAVAGGGPARRERRPGPRLRVPQARGESPHGTQVFPAKYAVDNGNVRSFHSRQSRLRARLAHGRSHPRPRYGQPRGRRDDLRRRDPDRRGRPRRAVREQAQRAPLRAGGRAIPRRRGHRLGHLPAARLSNGTVDRIAPSH